MKVTEHNVTPGDGVYEIQQLAQKLGAIVAEHAAPSGVRVCLIISVPDDPNLSGTYCNMQPAHLAPLLGDILAMLPKVEKQLKGGG